ncbi:MAG: ribosome small subunit-dependent GTPase A [Culicoidibacterales bacterium]
MEDFDNYGVTERYRNEATLYPELQLARVIAQFQGSYKVMTESGEKRAQISGKFRHETTELAKFPAVGDYVMITENNSNDVGMIQHVLTRKSVFLRSAVGVRNQAQVVAANIDTLFICMSVNSNYNLNRLERYLAIAWDSGAVPVIVLTKIDLCSDLAQILLEVETVSNFSDIITTTIEEENLSKFAPYIKHGKTVAFIGSSGVGKSTLINQLLGEDRLTTQNLGRDDKGKHTTTGRELFAAPLGGAMIDTPGMRELGLQQADIEKSFEDIEELAKHCRFSDCTHTTEPGCAIQQAMTNGLLEQRRVDNYLKLKNELGYEGLNSKQIEHQKLERMFKEVGGMKKAKKFVAEKRHVKYK